MILDVPLIRQPQHSKDCGIAGLAMILNYYDFSISFEDLKSEIEVDKIGTYAPQLGYYLIKKKFDVEIVTLHPKVFTNKDKNKTLDFLAHFQNLYNNSNSEQDKKVLNYFIEFLNNGGKIKVKIPNKGDVWEEIANKRPLGALLTSNFLLGEKPRFNFHFNVITGIDDRCIYVNDPSWNKLGGKHKYLISDFFFGVYTSSYGDLDNGCLIKIKKK